MTIVFLNVYIGIRQRGAERSTLSLAQHLSSRFRVCVLSARGEKKTGSERAYEHTVFPLPFPHLPDSSFSWFRQWYLDWWSLQILFFTLRALPFLWERRFDVVVPVNGGWQIVILRIFTWITRSTLVCIGRAGIGRDDAWNLLFRPDAFVALTRAALTWAKNRAGSVHVEHIPNGVDENIFSPEGDRFKTSLSHPIILVVSSLSRQKRVRCTIEAVSLLPQASLLVVGTGSLSPILRAEGERLLGKGRFLMTHGTFGEMPQYYRTADVFTLVSETGEAFGNVYLEALATNLPVVATDDSSRREIIGNAGLFVDGEDTASYAHCLSRALSCSWADIPRRRALEFSWTRVIPLYEKLFQSLR